MPVVIDIARESITVHPRDGLVRLVEPGPPGPVTRWSSGTVTTGAPGSSAAFTITGTPPEAVLNLTLPKGDKGDDGLDGKDGELTQRAADLRYERRGGLLSEAVWHVDAGELTDAGDGLADLTGNGRDAVFGAGAAAPVVLPWDGQDYLHFPDADNNYLLGVGTSAGMATRLVAVFDMDFVPRGIRCFVAQFGQSLLGAKRMRIEQNADGSVAVMKMDGSNAGESVNLGPWLLGRRLHRFTLDGLTIGYDTSLDGGATWTAPVTKSFTGDRVGIDKTVRSLFGAISDSNATARGNVYGFTLQHDGETTHALDPRNVNADYTKIKNTGTAGGDWTISRAASGFKTTVVDRPLLLFDLDQHATWNGALDAPELTVLMAVRFWSDSRTTQATCFDTLTSGGIVPGRSVVYRSNAASEAIYAWWTDKENTIVGSSKDGPLFAKGTVIIGGMFHRDRYTPYVNGLTNWGTVSNPPASHIVNGLRIGNRYSMGAGLVGEFLSCVVFDRALTDAEVAEATQELLGVPHTEQPDPHPQYVLATSSSIRRIGEWEQAATWSLLPLTGNWAGRRIRVADGLGLCLAVWDGSKWIVDAQSDTGVLNVPVLNGWTGEVRMWRTGYTCHMDIDTLSGAAATGNVFIGNHVGFRPIDPVGMHARGVLAQQHSALTNPGVIFAINSSGWAALRTTVTNAGGMIPWRTDQGWPTTAP